MSERVLDRSALSRATLARQMLLRREPLGVEEAIDRLGGLQAQFVKPAHIGLWTRLEDFEPQALGTLAQARKVVRGTLMRHTLHIATRRWYLRHRTAIQPALTRGWQGITARRTREGLITEESLARVLEQARQRLEQGPAGFAELKQAIERDEPGHDVSGLGYGVRTFLVLVQVAEGGRWGWPGVPAYALAEDWLGKAPRKQARPRDLIRDYLAAFGPASVADAQAWSYLSGLKPAFEMLREELETFRDERGVELFDLPDAPRPAGDEPAPPRLLPEYDNLMVSFADRTRVMSEEHRKLVSLPGARIRATFLLDGFVAGAWRFEKVKRGPHQIVLEPFVRVTKRDLAALTDEGEALLRKLHGEDAPVAVEVGAD